MRTIPDIADLLKPLKTSIRNDLLPAIFNGYLCSDNERELISLPTKFGGLGIFNPTERCTAEFNSSRLLTDAMVIKVKQQDSVYRPELEKKQQSLLNSIKQRKNRINKERMDRLSATFTDPVRSKIFQASIEPGSSDWLNTLPLKEYGLEKQAFWDSLYLRYNIPLRNLPSKCEARVDIAARGVWTEGQMAYFDVRVFNPIAKTYLGLDLASSYRRNEREKKRAYNLRIQLVDQ